MSCDSVVDRLLRTQRKDQQMPKCPKCGNELRRVHRSTLERALSHVYPVHRFYCKNPECGFEGRIADRARVKKRVLLLLLLVIGILALVILRFEL